ncbi:MAG: hypothetical protein QOJ64_4578 [Acidobacteriota bacterium]|jgi:HEAT repeat protein|nr:hypothetical protein [Acidobacteriota bacterium]
MKKSFCLFILLAIGASIAGAQTAQTDASANDDAAVAARKLASHDPLVRQGAAEVLARAGATEHRRVVEGYRLQEKNSRVRLALEWALYRMGKSESLFTIVRALDSSRDDQAASYLNTLEDPKPLYFFLERMNGNTQIKLLDILARVGDAGTLDKIKPYSNSFDSKIAEAAQRAAREIEQRLGETPANRSTRPRKAIASENTG